MTEEPIAVAARAGAVDEYCDAVADRVRGLRADIRAFVQLRANDGATEAVGGGNVMCTLAAFSLLGVLAKVVRAVRKPSEFVLQAAMSGACSSCGRGPRAHETNERNAFSSFTTWLTSTGVDLGLTPADAGHVWTEFRDWLVHRYDTKHFAVTISFKSEKGEPWTLAEVDKMLLDVKDEHKLKVLTKTPQAWRFYVDIFYVDLAAIEREVVALLRSETLKADSHEILDDLLLGKDGSTAADVAE